MNSAPGDNPTGDEIRTAIRSLVAKIYRVFSHGCLSSGYDTEFKVSSISHTRVFLRSTVLHFLIVCLCEASSESLGRAHFGDFQSWRRKQIQSPLLDERR